jgi:hypothetical protein
MMQRWLHSAEHYVAATMIAAPFARTVAECWGLFVGKLPQMLYAPSLTIRRRSRCDGAVQASAFGGRANPDLGDHWNMQGGLRAAQLSGAARERLRNPRHALGQADASLSYSHQAIHTSL